MESQIWNFCRHVFLDCGDWSVFIVLILLSHCVTCHISNLQFTDGWLPLPELCDAIRSKIQNTTILRYVFIQSMHSMQGLPVVVAILGVRIMYATIDVLPLIYHLAF
jgi:hypothetical protein